MEMTATCQVCGKDYDNFMRTFKVQTGDEKFTVCRDCQARYKEMTALHNQIWFLPHIPDFCTGGSQILNIFKNTKDFTDFLNTIPLKKDKIVYGDQGSSGVETVMTVSENGKNWWVQGYTNAKLKALGYDYWENCRKD